MSMIEGLGQEPLKFEPLGKPEKVVDYSTLFKLALGHSEGVSVESGRPSLSISEFEIKTIELDKTAASTEDLNLGKEEPSFSFSELNKELELLRDRTDLSEEEAHEKLSFVAHGLVEISLESSAIVQELYETTELILAIAEKHAPGSLDTAIRFLAVLPTFPLAIQNMIQLFQINQSIHEDTKKLKLLQTELAQLQANQDQDSLAITHKQSEIDILKLTIIEKNQKAQGLASALIKKGTLELPSVLCATQKIVEHLAKLPSFTQLAAGVQIAGALAGAVSAGLHMRNSIRVENQYLSATQDLRSSLTVVTPLAIDLNEEREEIDVTKTEELHEIPEMPYLKTSEASIDDQAWQQSREVINKTLERHQLNKQEYIVALDKSFSVLLKGIIHKIENQPLSDKEKFIALQEELKAYGVEVQDSDWKTFNTHIKQEDYKNALLEQYAIKKQTLNQIAKNELKNRIASNSKVHKSSFHLKTTLSKIGFAVAVILGAAVIVTTALGLATIALPLYALVLPGVVGVVAGVSMTLVGLFHLKGRRPQMFKQLLQFTKLRLLKNHLQKSFFELNLHRNQRKQAQNAIALKLLSASDPAHFEALRKIDENQIPKKLRSLFETIHQSSASLSSESLSSFRKKHANLLAHYTQQQAKIDKKIDSYEATVNLYQKNMDQLEQHLQEARILDFLDSSGYQSPGITETLQDLEKSSANLDQKEVKKALNEIKIQYFKQDIQALANAFIDGEFWNDPETSAFLEKYAEFKLSEDENHFDIPKNRELLQSQLMAIIMQDMESVMKWAQKKERGV